MEKTVSFFEKFRPYHWSSKWYNNIGAASTGVAFVGFVAWMLFTQIFSVITEQRKYLVSSQVETAISYAAALDKKAKTGAITEDEAKKTFLFFIENARYKGKEYYWVQQKTDSKNPVPKVILHPIVPALNGTFPNAEKFNQAKESTNSKGIFTKLKNQNLFVAFDDIGEGFVKYMWPKSKDNPKLYEKTSYVKIFKPWGWIIGNGVYSDDIWDIVIALGYTILIGASLIGIWSFFPPWLGSRVDSKRMELAILPCDAVGKGDLTVNCGMDRMLNDYGILSRAINFMKNSLKPLVIEVKNGIEQLSSTATELFATQKSLKEGVDGANGQIMTVVTAVEQMSATSADIAQNSILAAQSADMAHKTAVDGVKVVQETIDGMARISQKVIQSAKTVEELGAQSNEIGEMVGTIEDIADQTNLLALNAAIEAARAGEQGRGFAVVADEVRNLATRTTDATKQIANIIKAIQLQIDAAVKAMKEGVSEVEKGTRSSEESGRVLQNILSGVSGVTIQISQIATAAEEQACTTNEIAGNVMLISEIIHQTAKGIGDTAEAARNLSVLAEGQNTLVQKFNC